MDNDNNWMCIIEITIIVIIMIIMTVLGQHYMGMRFLTSLTLAVTTGTIISGILLGMSRNYNFDSPTVSSRKEFFEIMTLIYIIVITIHLAASSYREIARYRK